MGNLCDRCGGPTIELLFSRACKAECDIKARSLEEAKAAPFRHPDVKWTRDFTGLYNPPAASISNAPAVHPSTPPPGGYPVPANSLGPGVGSRTWTKAFPFAVYSFMQDLQAQSKTLDKVYRNRFVNVGFCTVFYVPGIKTITGIAIQDTINAQLLIPAEYKSISFRQDLIEVSCKRPGVTLSLTLFYRT